MDQKRLELIKILEASSGEKNFWSQNWINSKVEHLRIIWELRYMVGIVRLMRTQLEVRKYRKKK
jgi:hypothetical protein